jgi:hypothetical protein
MIEKLKKIHSNEIIKDNKSNNIYQENCTNKDVYDKNY